MIEGTTVCHNDILANRKGVQKETTKLETNTGKVEGFRGVLMILTYAKCEVICQEFFLIW